MQSSVQSPTVAAVPVDAPRIGAPFHPASDATPSDRPCTNCGATGLENFCPRCGQETHDLHRSLSGILGELLDAFAGWDGKIPATLWTMVRHPGGLTAEFLSGRRARYLRPLRLYLTMSVAFFLSLTLVTRPEVAAPSARGVTTLAPATIGGGPMVIQSDSALDGLIARHRNERGSGAAVWFKRHITGGLAHVKSLPRAQQQAVLFGAFVAKAPNMVFLLLPVFALLLRALYLRTPVFYAEHFVFALHNHAFAFFAMTVAHLASTWLARTHFRPLTALVLLWMPVYFFVSLRRVYGGSWRRTTLKFVTLSVVYGIVFFAATVVTMLFSIVTLA